MKKTIITTFIALLGFAAAGASDFATLSDKATRFIGHGEWASASAMLDLMLEEQPADASVYGRAIVVADIRNDSLDALRLMDRALLFHVPFDSVFSSVRTESFALGRSDLYERFLLSVAAHQPWLSRSVDGYLVKYYDFRHDGPKMVEYADRLLAGLPDDVAFLDIRARGLLLSGKTGEAVQTWRHIVAVDPGNYDALLYLGNYYHDMASENRSNQQYPVLARDYLSRAYAVRPTPYVADMLEYHRHR